MKKIAIYGAGDYGRKVINILRKTSHVCIVLVCDSDERKWGKSYEGYRISPPIQIFEAKLDGVFIAILADNDVEEYILGKKQIRIYKKIHELVAETVYWDISGYCNAKCKYCVTGRNNKKNLNYRTKSYVSVEEFKDNYQQLYKKGIISKESLFGLYNWNEPFLNPDIISILNYCSNEGQKYIISTNASSVQLATDKNTYSKCEQIYFSMPGFSQKSYDRIHGFKFDTIKKNIIKIQENMLKHGFSGDFIISAHIYRFSEREIESLRAWAYKEGLIVNAYYPYLAGNSLIADYFENRLDRETKEDISKDLFLKWDDEVSLESIRGFENPLCHQVTIDEKCNFTLCCMADELCEHFNDWGKINDIDSYDEYLKLKKKMLRSVTCIKCRKYAMAYRVLN